MFVIRVDDKWVSISCDVYNPYMLQLESNPKYVRKFERMDLAMQAIPFVKTGLSLKRPYDFKTKYNVRVCYRHK